MLFSSVAPRQRMRHAPRVGGEEHRRLARGVAGADDVDVEAVRRSAPRCAPRRRRCPCRRAGRSRRSSSCRHATPHARMIVRARRTSPPSRCTCASPASMRVIGARHQDLGSEPPRLLQRAARELVAGDARREAEVVLDPRRRAGLAAGRLALDDDRAEALRGAVDRRREPRRPGADDRRCRTPASAGSVVEAEQLRDPPELRPHDGLAADHADRRAGRRRPAAAPPHCSSASGSSGVSQRNVIWLRSRKRRSSAHAASQRWPTTIARGGGGSAAMPCRPRGPLMRWPREPPDLAPRRPGARRRRRGSRSARCA